MNWKEFLKPTIVKIILMIIFTVITTLLFYGLPLNNTIIYFGGPAQFDYFFMIIDIIFWYLISCIIASIYYHFRKPASPNSVGAS